MSIERVTGLDKENDLDEIVANHVAVHVERMACGHMWMQVRDVIGARELIEAMLTHHIDIVRRLTVVNAKLLNTWRENP